MTPGQDDGKGICYEYDSRDQVVRITGPDGTILQEQTYDSAGNVRTRLEGQSVYTAYAYDLAGDLLAVYKGRKTPGRTAARSVWLTMRGETSPLWRMEMGTRQDSA